jgi:glycosyltransferase involved in cell wall biosynthesis
LLESVIQLGVYPPPHGGVQTNVVAIHERLQDRGVRSSVISLSRHRHAGIPNVFFPETALEVGKLLLTLPSNVVHFHIGGDITNRLVALALLINSLPGRRTVLTLHSGGYPTSAQARQTRRVKLIHAVFRRFDALVGVNPEVKAFLANSGINPQKVYQLQPFPHLTRIKPGKASHLRLDSFCAHQKPLLATVGLLEPEYDLPLQFNVLRQLRQTYPEVGLVIVGSGSLHDELARQIALEPHNDRILLAGDVPHPITIELIRRADVLLRTTLYDGDAISVREALQLGTPVVATDNGMRPAHVFLAPIGDANRVAEQVIKALRTQRLTDTEMTPKIGVHDGIDAMLELYESLLG